MNWRTYIPPALILVCVTLLLMPAIPGGRTLLPAQFLASMSPWQTDSPVNVRQWNPLMWDAIAQFLPWRTLYHNALHRGELPLWNPYQFCGAPVYANVQSAIFYPPNLLFYVMDPSRALVFSAILHLFLAGLFAYLLARSLAVSHVGATVTGLVYALCAFNITWLELPTFVNVAAWLPLALLLVRLAMLRGSAPLAIGAGAAIAMALLAGHLQIAFYVVLATLVWWLFLAISLRKSGERRITASLGLLALIVVIGLGLAAVQLVPSIELGLLAHRASNLTSQGYSRYISLALPGMNLVTAFAPDFFGNPSKNTFWGPGNYAEYAMYIGILPLLLAIAALLFHRTKRNVIFFALLAAFSLLVALGTPLNAIFYYGVPGFGATGSPARILVLYCFSMAILAGFGASAFTAHRQPEDRNATFRRLAGVLIVVTIAAAAFLAAGLCTKLALGSLWDQLEDQVRLALRSVLLAGGLALLGGAILAFRAVDVIHARSATVLIILMTAADLIVFGCAYNAVCDRKDVYPVPPGVVFLKRVSGHERIMPINSRWGLRQTPAAVLPPNSSTVYGLRDTQGYDSLFPGTYKRFADGLQPLEPWGSSPIENGNIVFFKRYSKSAGRYARYIVSVQSITTPELKLVYNAEFRVYENKAALPRVELRPSSAGQLVWLSDGANRVELTIRSKAPATLILRDTMYPGWRAYVDDRPIAIKLTEQIFRSVAVPAGSHTVKFVFEPLSLKVGFCVSLLCLAACSAGLVIHWGSKNSRRSQ